eukprot:1787610-Rhodomonas_salina.8
MKQRIPSWTTERHGAPVRDGDYDRIAQTHGRRAEGEAGHSVGALVVREHAADLVGRQRHDAQPREHALDPPDSASARGCAERLGRRNAR